MTKNPAVQMRIDDPEFLKDMEMLGREITRCFGRASMKGNFLVSVIEELDELHVHLVSMNQGPEAVLVESAVKSLRAGCDRDEAPSLAESPVPVGAYGAPTAAEKQASQRPKKRRAPQSSSDAEPTYSDLPASFFQRTSDDESK